MICLFPTLEAALAFEARVLPTLPPVRNRPDIFGEQLVLDGEDRIVGHSDAFLAGASGISADETVALAVLLAARLSRPISTGHPTAFPPPLAIFRRPVSRLRR